MTLSLKVTVKIISCDQKTFGYCFFGHNQLRTRPYSWPRQNPMIKIWMKIWKAHQNVYEIIFAVQWKRWFSCGMQHTKKSLSRSSLSEFFVIISLSGAPGICWLELYAECCNIIRTHHRKCVVNCVRVYSVHRDRQSQCSLQENQKQSMRERELLSSKHCSLAYAVQHAVSALKHTRKTKPEVFPPKTLL